MAGRSDELNALNAGVAGAPHDPHSMSLLLGRRGFGKTTMLNEIEDTAATRGFLVLSDDASTPGLHTRLTEKLITAAETGSGVFGADLPTINRTLETTSGGLNLWGAAAGRSTTTESRQWNFGRILRHLGDEAKRHGSGVLITVDEMHAGDRMELVRLAADLQHVSPRGESSVAFVGAALNEALFTFLKDPRLSFFRRCEHVHVTALDRADVRLCLDSGIRDAAGTIEDDALEIMVNAAAGNPYRMQLIGYWAWQHASAPNRTIESSDALVAVQQADEIVRERVSEHLWENLSADERTAIRVVAKFDDAATPADIADALPLSSDTINSMLRRLNATGALDYQPGSGVKLGVLMDREFVAAAGAAASEIDAHRASTATHSDVQDHPTRCNLR